MGSAAGGAGPTPRRSLAWSTYSSPACTRKRRAVAAEAGGRASGAPGRTSPAALAARLDRILGGAAALVAAVPMPYLEHRSSGSGRSVGDLAFHLFRSALAFADGMDLGRLSPEWLAQARPPDLQDGESVARYGALARGRIAGWFEGAGSGEYARVIDAPGGPRTGRDLLERTVADAARDLIELYGMVEELGITPEPLPADVREGRPPSRGGEHRAGEGGS